MQDIEADRLRALASYAILDTPADPFFDRITDVVRLVFDAPIAVVSFVDDTRQWFKSHPGLDACETSREHAFCAHALPLERGGVLVVPDAACDPRFAGNPLVTGEPHIRFYAGAVLTSPEGASLGTLCLIDTKPRPGLTGVQAETLRAFASLVVGELEVRRATRLGDAKRELLSMAETMAGVGHWRLEVATGAVQWSDQVYRIHGVDRTSFDPQLQSALDFYEEADRSDVTGRLERAIRERKGYASHHRLRRADGERRTVLTRATCEIGPTGEVVALFGVFQDVTEQEALLREVSEERERYRLLADNANDMISTTALDSTVLFVTPAVRRLLGYEPAEMLGRRTLDLTHPDDIPGVTTFFGRLVRAGRGAAPLSYQFRGRHKDGRWVWLEGQPRVQFDAGGAPQVFQDVVRDVTARKQLETELDAARIEAEAAAQAKADFLANMSHELRTPLTSIIGFTGLAAEQPELLPLTRDYVRRVSNASRALLSTVNDILDFSKLEAGQVTLHSTPTDVGALARDAMELFLPQAAAKDLELRLEIAGPPVPTLTLDGDRLLQLLLNLIGNAVKFTEAGEIVVALGFAHGRLTAAVRDTGCGISPQAQTRLFKRFSQVDGSSTRVHGGTGLGLAICKALAEHMGGSIRVESEPGRGSRFILELPAAAASAPSPARPAAAAESLEGARVLVVDDHEMNRDLARLILTGAGALVSEADSGAAALALTSVEPFDVILLDLRMPDADGRFVLARLRGREGPNDLAPVLAYTADTLEEQGCDLVSAGFDGFVGKPVNPIALIAAVKRALAFDPKSAIPSERASLAG